jgi:hypothetical protein
MGCGITRNTIAIAQSPQKFDTFPDTATYDFKIDA